MPKNNAYSIPEKYRRLDGESYEHWLYRNLGLAFYEAKKGKRKTYDEAKFEAQLGRNLTQLTNDILHRAYEPSPGIAFVVHDPKDREVFAAQFRDRVTHHLLYNMSYEWWDARLIDSSYSCRKGKGVWAGCWDLRKKMNQARYEFGEEVYIVKLDIQGYFVSLNRQKVYRRVIWGLKRQFPPSPKTGYRPREYYMLRYLWRQVIFDDPTSHVEKRGSEKEWETVPASKSQFKQAPGIGIVIGNLSSQLLSNIYLDLLDRYVVYTLGYKFYGRYVDDFYFLVPKSKLNEAIADVGRIREYLRGLGLTLHPKKIYIQNINRGVLFLGNKIYPNMILPGPRIVKNYYKAIERVMAGEADIETLISYMGHFIHVKGTKIQQKIFGHVGLEFEM